MTHVVMPSNGNGSANRHPLGHYPDWVPLLQKPYDQGIGPRSVWDLRTETGTAVRVERNGNGLNCALFRVRLEDEVFTAQFFVGDERKQAFREWVALSALHAAGVRLAPEPITYAPTEPLPQPLVVCRFVNAVPITQGTITAQDISELVAALQHIHRTPVGPGLAPLPAWNQPTDPESYLNEVTDFVRVVEEWSDQVARSPRDLDSTVVDLPGLMPLIRDALTYARAGVAEAGPRVDTYQPVLVRADGNPDNVLRDESGRLCFVGWGDSGLGDPAFDLATFRWHPKGQGVSSAAWQDALACYEPDPEDKTFSARLDAYWRLIPVWWIGRSALHLLEGAGQLADGRPRRTIPARIYRTMRDQMDHYLAAIGIPV